MATKTTTKASFKEAAHSIDKVAINQLPDTCCRLMNGRIYLIINELFHYTQVLASQVRASHRQVVLITQSDPNKFLGSNQASPRNEQQQQFADLFEQGEVRIFQLKGSQIENAVDNKVQAQRAAKRNIEQMLKEIRYYIKAKNCLLVIENGRQMLGVEYSDLVVKVMAMWQEHIRFTGNTILFLLSGIQSNPLILNNIRLIQDQLAGFANISAEDGSSRLTIQNWYSSFGVSAKQQFNLAFDSQGFLQADVIESQIENQVVAASVDNDSVWTLRAVVSGEDWPQAWAVSERFDELDSRSEGAVGGTVILPYGQKTVIETLARQVFMLRKTRGNQLKIIIREVSARMRHSQERLIRFLGASMVAPLEVGFSRLLGIIDSIRDLEFEAQLVDDFDQAFILANPERKQGYLKPQVFVDHVNDLIEQTRSFGIKFAFVKLAIYKATRVVDVLKVCQIRRPGDICTADSNHIYIFLFGCRESDIGKALNFIFNIPIAQLFESEERNTTIDETMLALESLATKINKGKVKDHTDWLAKNRHQSTHPQGTEDAIFGYRQTVVEFNKQPAVAPVRKPLQLKSSL